MARRYGHRRRSSYTSRNIGLERATEHIRQAKELSKELGGTDKDVKSYFFSLQDSERVRIFEEYERLYGRPARDYAEKTIPKWRSGATHMSGMVAERLFSLLPKYMPIEQKFKLTENLWRHIGPISHRNIYVNPSVSLEELEKVVHNYLETDVLDYKIPEQMENRFQWLSDGDVSIKQQLLNYLRQLEKKLATESLLINLPILANHLQSAQGKFTTSVSHRMEIGKNSITVHLTEKVEGITENAPLVESSTNGETDWSWIWWVIGILVLFAVLGG